MKKQKVVENALKRLEQERTYYVNEQKEIEKKIKNYCENDKYYLKLQHDMLDENKKALLKTETAIQDYDAKLKQMNENNK